MNVQLTEQMRKRKILMVDFPVETGEFVTIEDDNQWIRGHIIDDIIDKEKVRVFLIDYGETVVRPQKEIHPLPRQFQNFPQFAVPLSLDGIQPPSGQTEYSTDATDCLRSLVDNQTHFKFKINVEKCKNFPIGVKSILDTKGRNIFREELVARNLAEVIPSLDSWDPMTSDYNAPFQSPFNEDNGHGPDQVEAQRFCKFFRFNGKCWRGNNCPFLHVQTGSGKFI